MEMKTVSKINQSLEQPWFVDFCDIAMTLLRFTIIVSFLILRIKQLG